MDETFRMRETARIPSVGADGRVLPNPMCAWRGSSGPRVRAVLLAVLALVAAPAKAEWRAAEVPLTWVTRQSASAPAPGWQVEEVERPCQLAAIAVRLGEADGREWLAPTDEAAETAPPGSGLATDIGPQWRLTREEAGRAILVLRYDCTWLVLATPWPAGATAVRVHTDPRTRVAGSPSIVAVEWWWPGEP